MTLEVRRTASGHYAVYDGERPVSGLVRSHDAALTMRDGLRARRARQEAERRPCLRCAAPFASEGAHNRLCPACGRRSAGPFDLALSVATSPRPALRGRS